jgi:MoaA/NifB/PqqE/SkfB family radical SAM enzyme
LIPPAIDFEMREGNNPIPELNIIEMNIAEQAYNMVNSNPSWTELGYKRAYNFLYILSTYMNRNPDVVKQLYKYAPYPESIEMEVTQTCPFECVFCEHVYWNEKPVIPLTFEKFKYAMDQFPRLKWAGNNALGDPFTNPDYFKMLHYLDDKGVVQEIYTNLQLITPEQLEEIVLMKGFVFFKISIEASNADLYHKLRVGSKWENVVTKVKLFDNLKKKHNKHFPELHFHYILMKPNMEDALPFLDFLDSLDIEISGVTYSRMLHKYKEAEDLYVEPTQEFGNKLIQRGKELGIRVMFNADTFADKAPAELCTAWLMPYIFCDGDIISCCCMNEQNRRYWQRETRMGNIFEKPFREIWYDKPYATMRQKLNEKKPLEAHPVCEICNIYDIKCYEKKDKC